MKWTRNRIGEPVERANDAVVAQIVAAKSRRIWRIVLVSNAVAILAAIAGCLFMMKSSGVKADVAQMRDEVGETLTMMTIRGASEAVSKYIPRLIDTTARWDRKFAEKREGFRGMDAEINNVQEMHRLGVTAERWLKDLEGISPMQRNEFWQKSLKAQVESEQKKWPNRTHKKGASEWLGDMGKEFWYGVKHGTLWPVGFYERTAVLVKGGGGIDKLEVGDRLRYILFPYRLSTFTMLRLLGIVLVTSAFGYLLCWIGLKSRFGWVSYLGLLYFFYLLNIALFIVWLEVTK